MANQTAPILEFESVTTEDDPRYGAPITLASFQLNRGDLGIFRFDRHFAKNPLADAAMGLVELADGDIRFAGDSWAKLRPGRAARRRGEIGRLFGHHGWVYHLDVDENITLCERHHTHRPYPEIEKEALALADFFGLPTGLPTARPATVDPHTLQKSACVRMLLGSPQLLIIDEPPGGLYPDVLAALKNFLPSARLRGMAVLWTTADADTWSTADIDPTFRGDVTEPGLALSVNSATAIE